MEYGKDYQPVKTCLHANNSTMEIILWLIHIFLRYIIDLFYFINFVIKKFVEKGLKARIHLFYLFYIQKV